MDDDVQDDVQDETVEEITLQKPSPVLVNKLDHTIKGGRYIDSDGTLRNAHGQLINSKGDVLDGSTTPPPPKME